MKKVIAILVSILFVLSVTGLCFAQAAPAAKAGDKVVKADDKAKDKKIDKKAKKVKKAKKAKKVKKAKKADKKAEKKDDKKPMAPEKK